MRLRLALLAVSCFAVACGPPPADFSGSYSGAIIRSMTCADGSHQDTYSGGVSVDQDGDTIKVSWEHCDGMEADVDGSIATVSSTKCPSHVNGSGTTLNTSISSGTLAVSGGYLAISVSGSTHFTYEDGTGETCSVQFTGSLQ